MDFYHVLTRLATFEANKLVLGVHLCHLLNGPLLIDDFVYASISSHVRILNSFKKRCAIFRTAQSRANKG